MITDEEFEMRSAERVSEGAAFMDALDKGLPEAERWYWIVNPDTLNMRQPVLSRDGCGCVMAQHIPNGIFDVTEYGLAATTDDDLLLGFDVSPFGRVGYADLTALWIEEINERRAAYFDRHPEAVIG